MIQLTLTGEEADAPRDLTLDAGKPQEWDDGTTSPTWLCPECGYCLLPEGRCGECGWFDRERWDTTLEAQTGDFGDE